MENMIISFPPLSNLFFPQFPHFFETVKRKRTVSIREPPELHIPHTEVFYFFKAAYSLLMKENNL